MCDKVFFRILCRVVLCAGALLAAGQTGASAQEKSNAPEPYKFEVRASWGGCPLYGGLVFNAVDGNDNLFNHFAYWEDFYGASPKDMYAGSYGKVRITGNVGVEFAWNIKTWLAVTGGLYANVIWATSYDSYSGAPDGYLTRTFLSVVPMARFSYLTRRNVRLYSAAGVGFSIGFTEDDGGFAPHIQTVPFGAAFGNKVYGFAQLDLGTLTLGGSFGIGVRF